MKLLKKKIKQLIIKSRVIGKPKIFCIGLNKTGTTSLEVAFKELGFVVGNQRQGELLLDDWIKYDYDRIYKLCKTAQVFQDAPFSYPYTYQYLDKRFPNSKFILTIRDNPEQWYNSLIRFHSKMWADGKRIPTKEDLMQADYIHKGRPWLTNRALFKTPEDDPYNKGLLLKYYESHVGNVIEYFKYKPNKLLVINISKKNSYIKMCNFLNKKPSRNEFPWENKT